MDDEHGQGRRRPVAPVASVVIPAHDEAAVIGRTLGGLLDFGGRDTLEVVVVCNGCTDDTASIAREHSGVLVLEIPEPSKQAAVAVGNRAATAFPRIHLDADVAISGVDVMRLARAVTTGAHAAAPARVVALGRSSWVVRAYYRVWEQLPQVREGLFGRGVVALSAEGQRRVDALPRVMSDDLAMSEAFAPAERRVVEEARAVVHAPRTAADLLRRRERVATGNAQATALGLRRETSVTTPSVLLRMAVREPRVGLRLPVFIGFGLVARWRSRRSVRAGDFTTWLRDESSRAA